MSGIDVTDFEAIVLALHSLVMICFLVEDLFSIVSGICRNVVHHPVGEAAWTRRVRVMYHKGKSFGFRGRISPRKLGRNVLALAGVFRGYWTSRLKSRAVQLHFLSLIDIRNHAGKPPVALCDLVDSDIQDSAQLAFATLN